VSASDNVQIVLSIGGSVGCYLEDDAIQQLKTLLGEKGVTWVGIPHDDRTTLINVAHIVRIDFP